MNKNAKVGMLALCSVGISFAQFGWAQEYGALENGSGSFSAGLWYEQGGGPSVTLSYSYDGFFGTDEEVSIKAEGSAHTRALTVSTVDADFFEGPFARTISLTAFSVSPTDVQGGDYNYSGSDLMVGLDRNVGGGLSFGFGIGYQVLSLDPNDPLPVAVSSFVSEQGNVTQTGSVFFNLSYDQTRGGDAYGNRPTGGYRLGQTTELGRTGDITYSKVALSYDGFHDLGRGFNLRTHGRVGHGQGSGGKALPIFKNYFGGGLGSLRGFSDGTLGPTSAIPLSTEVAHIGGDTSIFGGLEVSRPLAGRDDLFVSGFFDIGNVFGAGSSVSFEDMRQSVGISLSWDSPLGVLNVSLAKPLNEKPTDKLMQSQFSFGHSF